MTIQNVICEFLNKIQNLETLNSDGAKEILSKSEKEYLISNEAHPGNESASRYFKIFYQEIRTDQLLVQLTPMICFRSGYLKIDLDGKISVTDDNFIPYYSSKNF